MLQNHSYVVVRSSAIMYGNCMINFVFSGAAVPIL